MNASASFLRLDGIRKDYGDVTALSDLTLDIQENEFVTLLGPSGCGKTTTLRAIAGFVQPTAGAISLCRRTLSSPTTFMPPEKRDIGMVFQSYAVWPHMSVRANVELPLRLRRVPGSQVRRRCDAALDLCRLGHLAERDPHQLSGGQLQRVALARALVYEPALILLDEPLSNLDIALREDLRDELRRLHRSLNTTFILVTHDQVEAMSLSDRVVVMRNGCVEQIGSPDQIYRNPATKFVAQFVGGANIFDGVVQETGVGPDHQIRVDIRGVGILATSRHPVSKGEPVTVAIPQSSIDLYHDGEGPGEANMLTGRITSAVFAGRYREITIDVRGMVLRSFVEESVVLSNENDILLQIKSANIVAAN